MAGDLPEEKTKLLAASQRPAALNAFSDKTEFAAWHTVPSFAIVSTEDSAGVLQSAESLPPHPSGASGWHTLKLRVEG